MDFLDDKIVEYSENHSTAESEVLYQLNRETNRNVLQPRMLSGHLQGRVLSMISQMIQPKYILEIGTYTGYSAICFAEGLQKNGKLHTIDINEELEEISNKYFKKANLHNTIVQHVGDALEIIPKLEFHFDLVFIDADKENYLNYYNLLIDTMKSGSFILVDNVLWSGKVLDLSSVALEKDDKETLAIKKFNQKIQEDDRVENVLIPIRDGLMLIRVK